MPALIEFIHPLRNGSMREVCLAILYYYEKYEGLESQTVEQIRDKLSLARITQTRKINIADILAKSTPYTHVVGKVGKWYLWSLTDTGKEYIRNLLSLPFEDIDVIYDITTLESLVKKTPNKEITQYLEEALTCLKAGALRATVVFVWSGVTRHIQEQLINCDNTKLNLALQKHDPKSRQVKTVEDFAYIREKILLLATQDLEIYDKNQRGILEDALELRNNCGHPSKYTPGPKKVSSFIEDIVNIVFK